MSPSFLAEVERFEKCNTAAKPPRTYIGLAQFFDKESRGEKPDSPDPYFVHLEDGKRWWEWTLNEYAKRFDSREWPGWNAIAEDFMYDAAGFRQLRQRIGFEPCNPLEILSGQKH